MVVVGIERARFRGKCTYRLHVEHGKGSGETDFLHLESGRASARQVSEGRKPAS